MKSWIREKHMHFIESVSQSHAKPHRIKMPTRQDFKVPAAGFVACHLSAPRTLAHSVHQSFLRLPAGRFHPRFYYILLFQHVLEKIFPGQWRWRPGRNLQGRLQFPWRCLKCLLFSSLESQIVGWNQKGNVSKELRFQAARCKSRKCDSCWPVGT